MKTTTPLAPRLRPEPRLRRLYRLYRVYGTPTAAPRVRTRRRAVRVVAAFAAALVTLSGFTLYGLDRDATVRDPEYGRREASLRARLAEHPGRPLVLTVGSSRTAMGVCPAAWEEARPGTPADPLVFNLSLVGGGPVMELIALNRALAAGIRPDLVVLEYWPPFLREDGPRHEAARFDVPRLGPVDRAVVRDFFPDPAGTEREMRRLRANPVYGFRRRLIAQVVPSWLPWEQRPDGAWQGLDGWGWLPGVDEEPAETGRRAERMAHCRGYYRDQFDGYTVHPTADRAIREAVAAARGHGAKVAFLYLPEASEFRGWYPPAVERTAREHLAGLCRELAVPLVDTRDWMPDGYLVDGFHLSRVGAAAFTRRLVPALGGRP